MHLPLYTESPGQPGVSEGPPFPYLLITMWEDLAKLSISGLSPHPSVTPHVD